MRSAGPKELYLLEATVVCASTLSRKLSRTWPPGSSVALRHVERRDLELVALALEFFSEFRWCAGQLNLLLLKGPRAACHPGRGSSKTTLARSWNCGTPLVAAALHADVDGVVRVLLPTQPLSSAETLPMSLIFGPQAGLAKPMSSSITAFGPIGTRPGFGRLSLRNVIFSRHTLRRKSSKTWIVSCSPGHRR
jgi:hypothetical protein